MIFSGILGEGVVLSGWNNLTMKKLFDDVAKAAANVGSYASDAIQKQMQSLSKKFTF